MTFRDSINNLIRSDRPESPTDVVFLFGSIAMMGLWIYATQKPCSIPHIEAMTLFLAGCKAVKVGSDFQKKRKADCDATDKPI